jgi:hypothetical protein
MHGGGLRADGGRELAIVDVVFQSTDVGHGRAVRGDDLHG